MDKLQVRRPGRVLTTVISALLLLLAVLIVFPQEPVTPRHSFSVGMGQQVTDTVTTDAAPPDESATNGPKEATIVLGTLAMLAVVGLAFARHKSQ